MRVLLYHRLNIGDLILASPALQAFKADHPDARIGLVTNDFVAPVARLMPHVDECWSYAKLAREAPSEWRVLAKLRAFRPEMTIGLSPSPDRRLAFRVMLFPGGVGFGDGRALFRFAYRGKCLPAVGSGHVAATLAQLFGYTNGRALPDCRLEIPRATQGRLGALVFVDARKPSNRPSGKQVIALVEALLRECEGEIAIAGVPAGSGHAAHQGNAALATELRAAFAQQPRCVFPDVPIEGMIGLVARADSVICPDGGVMHLAAAAGCPVVALFGDLSPEVWGPRSRRSIALQAETRRVPDIAPGKILEAWRRLRG